MERTPTSPGADLTAMLVALHEKVDRVLEQNHQLMRHQQRAATPVDLIDTDEAARRAGVSKSTLRVLAARAVFTDGRPPDKRSMQNPRRWYADEIAVYRTAGEAGVRRLREEQGRD